MARTKRTAQAPGRPSPLLDLSRLRGELVRRLRRATRSPAHLSSATRHRTSACITAVVVLALFAQVGLVQLWIDEQAVVQLAGVQPHHRLVCDALGFDFGWYAALSAQKSGRDSQTP